MDNKIISLPCELCRKTIDYEKRIIKKIKYDEIDLSFEICDQCSQIKQDELNKKLLTVYRANTLFNIHNQITRLSFDINDSYLHKELLNLSASLIHSLSLIDQLGKQDHIIKTVHKRSMNLFNLTKEIKKQFKSNGEF